ncbi:hypothetical protein [Acetobacter fallax]|uniref:hypothetical protein n=1 Tax=Acetobacter fallax TaxID=1737473 RepID=UPI001F54AE54|nr:hypothetical protein [Acetobacter fallax]
MVVTMLTTLGFPRYIHAAMATGIGHDTFGPVRRNCEGPRLPLAGWTLAEDAFCRDQNRLSRAGYAN